MKNWVAGVAATIISGVVVWHLTVGLKSEKSEKLKVDQGIELPSDGNNRFIANASSEKNDQQLDFNMKLRSIVNQGNDASVMACRSLDTSSLNRFYKGKVLKEIAETIARFKAEKQYLECILKDRRFKSFKGSPAEDYAEVQLYEEWDLIYRSLLNDQIIYRATDKHSERIFLERSGNTWLVYRVNKTTVPPSPLQ